MSKRYHIYAYKHYWVDDDPVPVPYTKDEREYIIEAASEEEAIQKAEAEYGSAERTDKDGRYIKNDDGSWTLMGVTKVEMEEPTHE
jgi:hypothetical protein